MSIASELTNLEGNIEDSYDAVNDMGGIVPAQRNMDNLDQAIRTIPQGSSYTAGSGIDITGSTISVDNTTVPFFSDLASVATSGDYGDLINTPTIPTVNDATLTITQNGTSAGTFTANASSNTTIALTDTTYSNFGGATSSVAGSAGLVPAPTTSDPDKFLKGDGTWATVSAGSTVTEFFVRLNGGYQSTSLYEESSLQNAVTGQDVLDAFYDGQVIITRVNADGDTIDSYIAFDVKIQSNGSPIVYVNYMDKYRIKFNYSDLSGTTTYVDWTELQKKLTAGTNITISSGGTISATDTTYSAFTGATSGAAGTSGLVPAPAAGDEGKVLQGDGTWVAQTAAQVNSDWNAASGVAQILNKPSLATVATSGDYDDLTNKPTIPAAQVQSDWSQTTTTAVDYIKNKPTIPTVNNATLTIQKNSSNVATFTANASSNVTANITVPSKTQLASGGTASTTTTNLSQAPSNFDYLFVDTVTNDNLIKTVVVPNGSTKFSTCDVGWASGMYLKWASWEISGSKITRTFSTESSNYGAASTGNFIGIKRVVGVKIP